MIKIFKAISHCDSIGGRIFTPKNEEDNQLLADLYKSLDNNKLGGMHKIGIAIHWKGGKWIDSYTNQPPTYVNWENDEEPKCEQDEQKAHF